ncbi:MAG TPA: glycosyl hydrolase [Pyrinomonadaceae bacterium]|jgi:hypothetical protein
MKRRTFLKTSGAASLLTLITRTGFTHSRLPIAESGLEESFVKPPDSAKPYTWWHWMNGNVTKEGITLDLEAMKRVGLGGFQQFDVGKFTPIGPAVFGSPEYWELKKHAIKEAERLGLNFEMHNCPGWSSSGGPWISPELSMQVVTWSEAYVEGGKLVMFKLPRPKAKHDYYRDAFVLAFPSSNPPLIADWKVKANFPRGYDLDQSMKESGEKSTGQSNGIPIDPNSVLDIRQYMDGQGRLNWQAPPGDWTILRFGSTTSSQVNRSGPDGGIGLECDKFNKAAIEFHFNKVLENLLPTLMPLARKDHVGLLIDSYEVGRQNWTPAFPAEFKKRRGYDLVPFLPAMTGRMVGNGEMSEQFLWDLRRTQADLMADNYYGHFTKLCHEHGIAVYTEPYGSGNFEELQVGSRADRVMGEFWLDEGNSRSVKLAASVGHVFGKRVVGAESFTALPSQTQWKEYPFLLKPMGDWMFTQGINRFYFHRFAHQPHPTAQPGMTMGPWGFHFDRTNTWFEKGKQWLEYLARCQSLLQQGVFVADLLYFGGQDAPAETPVLPAQLDPPPPEGYQWDVVNAEAILNRVAVRDGRIVLPDGMSYRLLIIPAKTSMTLPVLIRLRALVRQGMILVGNRPERSPSLSDQNRRNEFNRITAEIWGDLKEDSATELRVGRGYVFSRKPLEPVLKKLSIGPDFEFTSRSSDAPINYIHRTIDGVEVYFVANRRRRYEDVVATFRVEGKRPELWDPNKGEIKPLGVYELVDRGVRVPLQFDPAGSVFLVFRSPASRRRLQTVAKDGNVLLSTQPFTAPRRGLYRDISNNFTISVWAKPEIDVPMPADLDKAAEIFNYIIYPPAGEKLYGLGHAACGLTAGRNGVILFERSSGNVKPVLKAQTPIAGWTHLALTYKDGVPALYINGTLVQRGKASGTAVHPGLGEAHQSDGAYYYLGHISDPQLFQEVLNEDCIRELVAIGAPKPEEPPAIETGGNKRPGFVIWQDGNYRFRDNHGRSSSLEINGIGKPRELTGPWYVSFPPNLGAPAEITLPNLMSLHRHSDAGVRYFSGICTYRKRFGVPNDVLANDKRLFLDLGRVEVIAEVSLNGRNLGSLWKPPYRVDITDVVKIGENDLQIELTNLWPNRLIGDEQLPAENEYYPGRGYGGDFPAGIKKLPDWYVAGKPKPAGGRISFTAWKHYDKDSPLLESGLLGPVMLRTARPHSILQIVP